MRLFKMESALRLLRSIDRTQFLSKTFGVLQSASFEDCYVLITRLGLRKMGAEVWSQVTALREGDVWQKVLQAIADEDWSDRCVMARRFLKTPEQRLVLGALQGIRGPEAVVQIVSLGCRVESVMTRIQEVVMAMVKSGLTSFQELESRGLLSLTGLSGHKEGEVHYA